MATSGGGGGGGVDGRNGNSSNPTSPSSYLFGTSPGRHTPFSRSQPHRTSQPGSGGIARVRADDIVHCFVERNHQLQYMVTSRRRAHSTSSSTSTLSHTSSLLVEAAIANGTPTSPRHSMLSMPSAYALRGMQRNRSIGESSSGYPSPMMRPPPAVAAGGSTGSSLAHTGARSATSLPMEASAAATPPPRMRTERRTSAPLALSPTFHPPVSNAIAGYDSFDSYSASSAAASAAMAARSGGRSRTTRSSGPWAAAADRLSPMAASVDARGHNNNNPGSSAATASPAASAYREDGYDASSENLASASGGRPKTSKSEKDSKKSSKGWTATLRRRKGKPDAKRRDDGGLSDIAASATPSQCPTPVPPVGAGDDDGDEPALLRKISAGNSPSPTSDREDGKKKSEQSGFLNRFRHFKRSVSKDAAANLSDGNGSDTSKRKKEKKRSSRRLRGHFRQRSEDLNNNDPNARLPESAASSSSTLTRGRRSSATAQASGDLSTSASSSMFASSNSVDPYELSSSSDDDMEKAVSGLRDELSQEIHISPFPTPGPSSPATPNLSHSAGSSQRPPGPYSSDVDTGDRLYDSASMTSDPTSAAGRRNSFRSDDESLSRAEQATVDNLVDKISDMADCIDDGHNAAIQRVVEKLMNSDKIANIEQFANHAFELLRMVGKISSEFNIMLLLVLTTRLLTALPDAIRHLEKDIVMHSSYLLKIWFPKYFTSGFARASAFFRKSFGQGGVRPGRRDSASAASGSQRSAASPLASVQQVDANGMPVLRLRGAEGGTSVRETRRRPQQEQSPGTPVLRLRPATSAPVLDNSHLAEDFQPDTDMYE